MICIVVLVQYYLWSRDAVCRAANLSTLSRRLRRSADRGGTGKPRSVVLSDRVGGAAAVARPRVVADPARDRGSGNADEGIGRRERVEPEGASEVLVAVLPDAAAPGSRDEADVVPVAEREDTPTAGVERARPELTPLPEGMRCVRVVVVAMLIGPAECLLSGTAVLPDAAEGAGRDKRGAAFIAELRSVPKLRAGLAAAALDATAPTALDESLSVGRGPTVGGPMVPGLGSPDTGALDGSRDAACDVDTVDEDRAMVDAVDRTEDDLATGSAGLLVAAAGSRALPASLSDSLRLCIDAARPEGAGTGRASSRAEALAGIGRDPTDSGTRLGGPALGSRAGWAEAEVVLAI